MATATKTAVTCAPPERLARLLREETSEYMGLCLVQAPGGWTRAGATWRTRHGWIVWGPGVRSWGTKAGLAELASSSSPSPSWHAPAWAVSESPNLVFYVEPEAKPVRAQCDPYDAAARAWIESDA